MLFGPCKNQVRVACQVPLQRSPEMIPLQEPAPALPTSRPPAAAGGMRRADLDPDRHGAGPVDLAFDLAATGRGNPAARDGKGNAVAGAANAPGGGENHVPDAIIGAGRARFGSRRRKR